ncbi:hypothetical protein EII34_15015 [Arachnia propionica]|uniref:Uncharacterized protein n=1 Tax=Arachnia propionica TaxID=1750 RepID=A0A3P1T1R6_9ACTN|nr:hypothetical protein [Arachnia propionica]RRD03215.1 hypothetical protein EII34_15015 [Arachnia propionica]
MNPNVRKAARTLDWLQDRTKSPEGLDPRHAQPSTLAAQTLALIAIADELHLANLLALRGHTIRDSDRDITELEHAMERSGLSWVEYAEKEDQ